MGLDMAAGWTWQLAEQGCRQDLAVDGTAQSRLAAWGLGGKQEGGMVGKGAGWGRRTRRRAGHGGWIDNAEQVGRWGVGGGAGSGGLEGREDWNGT